MLRGESPTAIVLAGGLGTRLRDVLPDCPKPMVPISGRPFLDYLLRYLGAQGVKEAVISTGYRGDMIEARYREGLPGMRIRCVREQRPLGTGGATSFVLSGLRSQPWILVVNGDSLVAFSLSVLLERAAPDVDGVIIGVRVEDARRFGTLCIGEGSVLRGFREKAEEIAAATINGGIYLLRPLLFPADLDAEPASLEHDYLPRWLREGRRILVEPSEGPFIDIGTPESLAGASRFVSESGLFQGLE